MGFWMPISGGARYRRLAFNSQSIGVNRNREHQLEGERLGLQLLFSGDRYAHRICLRQAGGWIDILSSVEGTADDAWPPSPPFQALDLECTDDGRQLALLVGMACRSHWSASIELDSRHDLLRFEIACRTGERLCKLLTSRYRAAAEVLCTRVKKGKMLACMPSLRRWQLYVETCMEHSPADLKTDASGFAVVAKHLDLGNERRTIRWAYTIGIQATRQC